MGSVRCTCRRQRPQNSFEVRTALALTSRSLALTHSRCWCGWKRPGPAAKPLNSITCAAACLALKRNSLADESPALWQASHTPNLLITPLGCPSAHSPPQPTRSDNPPEPPKGAKTPHHASHQAQARHCTRLPSPQSNTSKPTPQKSSQNRIPTDLSTTAS